MSIQTRGGSNFKKGCLVAGLSLIVGSLATGQERAPAVQSDITAYTITLDADGREVRKVADQIVPGGIIEYTLTYKNVSREALSDFVILGKVPEATDYHSSEAIKQVQAVFEVSVSDIGWTTPPVMRYEDDGTGVLRPVKVPEEEFEALRWRLAEPITPGEEVSATYRIRVED
jgi:hypothetical protein